MTDAHLILLIGSTLAAVAVVPFVVRRRRTERTAADVASAAREVGLHEPISLHPIVDPAKCLGCGACTRVCPEGDVLALVGGQARPVAPARCVGHGLCERACPTDAITLVFGTAQRGVELPRVQGDYQTNVPGLYIVGELGGMGLVRNAFSQGRQAAEGIVRLAGRERPTAGDRLDVLVVGGGPAGLSAAIAFQRAGLRYAVVEKEDGLGGAVRHYPRRKLVLTQPFEIPGYGKLDAREIPKEELMTLWADVARSSGVEAAVVARQTVQAVRPDGDGFTVETREGERWQARRVVLAIGRRGIPRKLGVPGEASPHVAYSLAEPEAYAGRRVLVVGGGDSAVEAALQLGRQPATEVRLSYRQPGLRRAKPANVERFQEATAAGRIRPFWETTVAEIADDHARLTGPDGEATIPADDVFVFAGGELPTAFLAACGIELDVKFGQP